jgi:pimeloyl-ACP methyl ester carboxylesterase
MELKHGEGITNINGVPVWHKVVGTGPVLVVQSPGWGIGSKIYQQTLADLSAHHTLVFHDTRGSGASTGPDLDYASVNVGQFVQDLEALARHLELDKFTLLGHSHGGYIALNYAVKFPERLEGLVLVDAQLGVAEPGADLQRTLPLLADVSGYRDAVAAFTGPREIGNDSEFSAFLRKIGPLYFRNPAGPAFERFVAFIENNPVSLRSFLATSSTDSRFEVRTMLPTIGVPTLCMVGDHDFICSPVQAEAIAQGIPGAELSRFADSGHFCWIEEPAAFRTALENFLGRDKRS